MNIHVIKELVTRRSLKIQQLENILDVENVENGQKKDTKIPSQEQLSR